MILSRLVQMIRVKAMIVGSDEYTSTIIECINETLSRYTRKFRYPELFIANHEITATAATGSVALPTDLQHLDEKSIRYQTTGASTLDTFLRFSNRFNIGTDGSPSQWYRSGSTLKFNPYSDVGGTDKIIISYWKTHTALIGDADTFPIADLETCVLFDVAAQMAMYNGRPDAPALAGMLKQQAREEYSAVFSVVGRDSNQ